ncbi:Protein RAE1 [Porphyridium purpureum]|uniref:Protein RAE1 n=1 Tax=Porphyridium purpureum TaxID=35688 RepID=A0A5J4YY25_PORPP|nr:Protein RAE1 [Porphyridium purpureum]|eukprot:POR9040..scf209_3
MAAFGAATGTAADNPNNDILVSNPPNDGISSLAFSPRALAPKNFLVAGSWDNGVRCWEVQQSGQTVPVGMIEHSAPVLDVTWREDGQAIFSAGCDKQAKMWSIATNQNQVIAQHDAPISKIAYLNDVGNGTPCVVTGSWDKTLKYWDIRAPTGSPMGVVPMPERVYAMDARGALLVVGTADRKILVYDVRKPTQPYLDKLSQLKYQTRVIACFPDQRGFAVGSVEGRVSIDHVQQSDRPNDFAFKCHREENNIYSVNSIAFHEGYGTFATAGSNGTFIFWDKDSKQRLKNFKKLLQPITASCFSADGSIYAYAVGYDWSKGAEGHVAGSKNYILLHGVQDAEVRGKDKQAKPGLFSGK